MATCIWGWCIATSTADELKGERSPKGFVETANHVRATLHEGYVELVVVRSIENQGPTTDEAQWTLDVPDTAVATGLRTQGRAAGKSVWYDGVLLPQAIAAERYRYLTGRGVARPRDPALLYWMSPTTLGLRVFPCAASEPKSIEYTLQLPLSYKDGRYSGHIAPIGTPEQPATVEVRSGVPASTAVLDGVELAPGATGIRRNHREGISVELRPNLTRPITAELAVADLSTGRSYLRYELRAAPRISTIPIGADLVFIFDQSRSGGTTWTAQRNLFEQVLRHFPSAQVLAIGFDRVARNMTNGFVPAARAKELLRAFPETTRNGSRIDRALVMALENVVKRHPKRETTRLFLLSDALAPSAIPTTDISRQIAEFPAKAQVVNAVDGLCHVSHRTEHDWQQATESTGGTVWEVSLSDLNCLEELEELARPKRYFVKKVELEPTSEPIALPDTLDEGQAFTHQALVPGRPAALQFEAKLWGQTVTQRWTVDATATRVRSAFIAADNNVDQSLTEQEQLRLAMLGRAVTSLTSYLAVEPGVRPSTDGLERGGHGGGEGFGSSWIGGSADRAVKERFEPQRYLEDVVARLRHHCGIPYQRVTVEIETSFQEILDVARAEVHDSPPSASGCLEANLWEEELPTQFDKARARYVVVR
jgi:nitroreductase